MSAFSDHLSTVRLNECRMIFASKHECSPLAHKAGYELLAEVVRLRAELAAARERAITIRKCSTECWQTGMCDGSCGAAASGGEE